MGIVGIVTFFLVMLPHLWWFVKKRGTRSFHGLMTVACVSQNIFPKLMSDHRDPWLRCQNLFPQVALCRELIHWIATDLQSMGFLASSYLIQAVRLLS